MTYSNAAARIVEVLLAEPLVKRATKYLSPGTTVKGTRVGKFDGRQRQQDIRVTIGKPNYSERKFIKVALKSGEPFPVRGLILKYERKK